MPPRSVRKAFKPEASGDASLRGKCKTNSPKNGRKSVRPARAAEVVGPYEAERFARVNVGATCGRPLVRRLQMSAGGRRPPLREMRIEFAEKQQIIGASCAGG